MDDRTRLADLQKHIENLPFERFCEQHAVYGDVQECPDRLQAIRDACPLSQLICGFDQGSRLPPAAAKQAMGHFAEAVRPHL